MRMRKLLTSFGALTAGLVLAAQLITSQPAAAAWWCGSQCNNQSPNWIVPSNGVRCSNSAVQVAQGNPRATWSGLGQHGVQEYKTETDTSVVVKVMYSTVCRTLWGVITNNQPAILVCDSNVKRIIPAHWISPNYGCPPVGGTAATRMVDDYSPTGGIAAEVKVLESQNRTICEAPGPGEPCTSTYNAPVYFIYSFRY